jgi:hypothetical protein
MVVVPWGNRRGTSTRGCLVSLLVLVVALYYGINIGEVWYRFYQMQEEMTAQARLAPGISDGVIRRRLQAKADDLGRPPEARTISIIRSGQSRHITIQSEYAESVDLPFLNHTFTFKPRAEAPL